MQKLIHTMQQLQCRPIGYWEYTMYGGKNIVLGNSRVIELTLRDYWNMITDSSISTAPLLNIQALPPLPVFQLGQSLL